MRYLLPILLTASIASAGCIEPSSVTLTAQEMLRFQHFNQKDAVIAYAKRQEARLLKKSAETPKERIARTIRGSFDEANIQQMALVMHKGSVMYRVKTQIGQKTVTFWVDPVTGALLNRRCITNL